MSKDLGKAANACKSPCSMGDRTSTVVGPEDAVLGISCYPWFVAPTAQPNWHRLCAAAQSRAADPLMRTLCCS